MIFRKSHSNPARDPEFLCHSIFFLLNSPVTNYFLRMRRATAIESFNAAEISASPVTTCAALGIPDSRPSHACSSARSATVNRPSRLTGIPAFAHLCAVAELRPRNLAIAPHPLSRSAVSAFCFNFAIDDRM
jgi:hypothetical protein